MSIYLTVPNITSQVLFAFDFGVIVFLASRPSFGLDVSLLVVSCMLAMFLLLSWVGFSLIWGNGLPTRDTI